MTQGFSVSVDLDYNPVLQGLKRVEQAAQAAGQTAGKALGDGIEGVASKSIDALLADLGRLKAQRNQIQIDGGQITALNQQIGAVQKQIDTLRAARVAVQADPKSIDEFNQKLGDLRSALNSVAIGSDRFKELQAQISATERELAKAGQSGSGLKALDSVIQGVAFSLTNTLTNAAITAIQSISQIAGEVRKFDSAKAAVRTLGVDADDLGDRLLKLSASTKGNVSAVDLLKASYDVASADATNILAAAQNGAVGGFTDINTVADATTSVLNAYGLSSDKAAKLIDGFIQTQNDGKIVVGQYAQEIGRIAPVAAASGVSIDELNAAISAATAQGVPVGSTFAGLRQAISSILKPSAEASQYAASLGINFSASELKAKGFGGLMKEIAEKTGGSAEAIIKLTGSVEAQAAIQPLVNDGLVKYNQFLANQAGSAGVAADAADKATATVDGSLKRLANTLSNLGVQAFQGIAPIVTAGVNALNNILISINAIPGPVKVLIGAMVGVPIVFGAATASILVFNGVVKSAIIQDFAAQFIQLSSTLATTFVTGVKAAAAAVPGLLSVMASLASVNVTEKIAELVTALRVGLPTALAAAKLNVIALVEAFKAFDFAALLGGIRSVVAAFAPLALSLTAAAAGIAAFKYVLDGAGEGSSSFTEAQEEVTKAIANLGDAAKKSTADLRPWWKAILDSTPIISDLGRALQRSRDDMELLGSTKGLAGLQASFLRIQQPAIEFLNTLRNSSTITAAQTEQAAKYIESLNGIGSAAASASKSLRAKAQAAEDAGNPELAANLRKQADALDGESRSITALVTGLQNQVARTKDASAATAQQTSLTEIQQKAVKDRAKAEEDLNKILAEAPVRRLTSQLEVGQQLLNQGKAIGELEQVRYAATKSTLQYELKVLQDRGAGEVELAAKKEQIDRVENEALGAKYKALLKQQDLEAAILSISQEKARKEADLAVLNQRAEILKAEVELTKAKNSADDILINSAIAQKKLQEAILGIKEEAVKTLDKTQPLEKEIAKTQAEAARSGLENEASAKGIKIAADGTVTVLNQISEVEKARINQAEQLRKVYEDIRITSLKPQSEALQRQADLGDKLVSYSKSLGDLEQSRYGIIKSRLEYELNGLQKSGASKEAIAAKQAQIDQAEQQAMNARFSALIQQQQLENSILAIKQQRELIDANIEALKQRSRFLGAEFDLQKAMLTNDPVKIGNARLVYEQEKQTLDAAIQKVQLIRQLQPIEAKMAQVVNETAQNNLISAAAAKGYSLSISGTIANVGALAVNTAAIASSSGDFASNYETTAQASFEARNTSKELAAALRAAGVPASDIGIEVKKGAQELNKSKNSAGDMSMSLSSSKSHAGDLASSFVSTGKNAPKAAQGARDFAGWLSGAKNYAAKIADLDLATSMKSVATATKQASLAARDFYDWLKKASGLPGSRWTGGPVEAGSEYRVNELGQEALLSAGRLSLIQAPQNAIWRAPASGVVIPAGITAKLKDAGALPTAGSGSLAGVAELAIEVGNLRQEVASLVRKDWSIHVQQRTGPTASQVMNQLHRLR